MKLGHFICGMSVEKHLGIKYSEHKSKRRKTTWENKTKRAFVRYADDFIILCRTEEDAIKAKEETRLWLEEKGLELSPEKTHITHITKGLP